MRWRIFPRMMKKISGVDGVETSYNFNARIKLGDTGSDARGEIAGFGYFDLEGLKVTAGKLLDKKNPKEILVSSAVGKVFGKDPKDLVGQKISFSLLPSATAEVPAPRANIDAGDYTIAGVTENEEAVFYAPADGLNIPADIPFATNEKALFTSSAPAGHLLPRGEGMITTPLAYVWGTSTQLIGG